MLQREARLVLGLADVHLLWVDDRRGYVARVRRELLPRRARKVAAEHPHLAAVVAGVHAVDEHQTGDVVRMTARVEKAEQSAVGVTGEHDRSAHAGSVQQ